MRDECMRALDSILARSPAYLDEVSAVRTYIESLEAPQAPVAAPVAPVEVEPPLDAAVEPPAQ